LKKKYFSNRDVRDERVSVRQIIAEMKGKGESQVTIVQAYNYHIQKITELQGIDYAKTTIDKYGYSLNSLGRFLQAEYNKSDLRLCDLELAFVENYYAYLTSKEGIKQNTAAKSIKHLVRIINISIRNRWMANNPFKEFKCTYKNPERAYLTQEEIIF
jgi:integrase/recombinase XerD